MFKNTGEGGLVLPARLFDPADIVAAFVSPVVMAVILLSVDWRLGLASIVGVIIAFIIQSIAYGRGGTGLGLSIVSDTVRRQGGTVEAANRGDLLNSLESLGAAVHEVISHHDLHSLFQKLYAGMAADIAAASTRSSHRRSPTLLKSFTVPSLPTWGASPWRSTRRTAAGDSGARAEGPVVKALDNPMLLCPSYRLPIIGVRCYIRKGRFPAPRTSLQTVKNGREHSPRYNSSAVPP